MEVSWGVMKMGNNVPRAGLKPISLAFRASVLPLHHIGSLMSSPYICASEVSADYKTYVKDKAICFQNTETLQVHD